MSGYTPVFDSVYHGTLCGKWPSLPVWLSILPMADKNGCIDMTYQAIAALTGWPIDLLRQGIAELMQPDSESRSEIADGRRLELIDAGARQWGWRVINHIKYREKARKQMQQVESTASGKDAERKRIERERVQRCPAKSSADRPSDSDSDSDKEKDKEALPSVAGLDFAASERWIAYRKEIGKPLKASSIPAMQRKLAKFGSAQADVVEESIANGYQGLFAPKANGKANAGGWI